MNEIKTWQERQPAPSEGKEWFPFMKIPYMQAEIDELRSALHRAEAREEVNEEIIENDYVLLGELRAENARLKELLGQALGALKYRIQPGQVASDYVSEHMRLEKEAVTNIEKEGIK